jgi:hypothetical protein
MADALDRLCRRMPEGDEAGSGNGAGSAKPATAMDDDRLSGARGSQYLLNQLGEPRHGFRGWRTGVLDWEMDRVGRISGIT